MCMKSGTACAKVASWEASSEIHRFLNQSLTTCHTAVGKYNFDVVIIDEATRALEAVRSAAEQIWLPLSLTIYLLSGLLDSNIQSQEIDIGWGPMQLPPTVSSNIKRDKKKQDESNVVVVPSKPNQDKITPPKEKSAQNPVIASSQDTDQSGSDSTENEDDQHDTPDTRVVSPLREKIFPPYDLRELWKPPSRKNVWLKNQMYAGCSIIV